MITDFFKFKFVISVSPNKKILNEFLVKTVPCNAERRFAEERKVRETNQDIAVKLDHILCKNEPFINDKKFKYFLITNNVCSEACCRMGNPSEMNWIKSIEWQAVFDFNPDTFQNGMGSMVMNSDEILVKPCGITGSFDKVLIFITCSLISVSYWGNARQ